ncbi:MAG: D-glycero-beta-D-manno-heptose-7-phosphate kinase [Alphaproteobacteria bacterium]|nr:D-glycero-beta-D-manno-heptose-7-phosphate kinase [Alphaproteobacteria bacterium]
MTLSPKTIDQLSSGAVLVIGDVMIDHYVSGQVSRVSDEAPVPIIRVEDERWTPGGAANVAANIAALGGRAALAGVAGEDPAAETLFRLLGNLRDGIEPHLVAETDRPTTIKTRYMGGQHQIVRVDRERQAAIGAASEDALIATVSRLASQYKAVAISDYAKGVLTDRVLKATIAAAKAARCATLVDPKRTDWSAYKGAALITPNRKELMAATGLPCATDEDCARAAAAAIRTTGAAILLTRSEKGMSLYREDAEPAHLPAKAREVFDVSGAGDTVAAAVALALAAGLAIEEAMAIANLAAGIVVGKRGTATASQGELKAELGGSRFGAGPDASGALPLEEVAALRKRWAREGLSVGFTNGCFDLLHPGHISLLRQAGAACDRLIVALNTDASVRRLKGPSRPVQSEAARAAVMAAVKGVDAVVMFAEETPLELIRAIEPDVLVKGADYAEGEIVGADIVKARGGRVVRAQLVDGQSTTRMIEKSGKS